MPDNALDDTATYRKIADKAYSDRAKNATRNPRAVLASQEAEAMGENASPAVSTPGPKFTKGFSPAERAEQAAKLKAKLAERGD